MSSLRRRRFLEFRCTGKSTYESYKAAGYKGTRHAAYQLLSDCKEELQAMLSNKGLDLESRAETCASLNQKLELLKLIQKFSSATE